MRVRLNCMRTFAVISLFLVSISFSTAASAQLTASKKPVPTSSNKLLLRSSLHAFGVLTDEVQGDLGFECEQIDSTHTRVRSIRPGSEAYYQGLQVGDTILSARASGNNFTLDLKRNANRYTIQLTRLLEGGTDLSTAAPPAKSQGQRQKPQT